TLIAAGRVEVRGSLASKAAAQVDPADAVRVLESDGGADYVSRGGHKLAGALAAFGTELPKGRRCLDAGASTGGFTDVLLRAGAAAWQLGLGVAGVTVSPLPGPSGNVEFFLRLRRDAPPVDAAAVSTVVGAG